MSEEYSNGYARGYEAGQQSVLKLAKQPAPMSQPNRVIAYSATTKLRELGYEWVDGEWEQPAQQEKESWEDLHNALQRIDTAAVGLPTFEVRHEGGLDAVTQNIVDAITALHTQPAQQEPVACPDGKPCKHGAWCTETYCQEHCEFRTPPQPEQEPVACIGSLNEFRAMELVNRGFALTDHLYTTPPKTAGLLREIAALSANALDDYKMIQSLMAQRKPLTMKERTSIVRANKSFHDKNEIDAYGIIDDVEAAHGITKKNT